MKDASKAKTIGEKLYHLERIHSKIITYTIPDQGINKFLKDSNFNKLLDNLEELVKCFIENSTNHLEINNYLNSIIQTKNILNRDSNSLDLFISCCYMHGCYTKFRKFIKTKIKRGCEIEFQEVCFPLLMIELQIKEGK